MICCHTLQQEVFETLYMSVMMMMMMMLMMQKKKEMMTQKKKANSRTFSP